MTQMIYENGEEQFFPEPLSKLTKDIIQTNSRLIGKEQARKLVDTYYNIQDFRKAAANEVRAQEVSQEPHELHLWIKNAMNTIENNIRKALEVYTDYEESGMGLWCKNITGVGPVLAAGMLAHVDITKVGCTVNGLWRYAGKDPTVKWYSRIEAQSIVKEAEIGNNLDESIITRFAEIVGKNPDGLITWAKKYSTGKKITSTSLVKALARRPYNLSFKTLTFKVADCFIKFSNNPDCHYGHLYAMKKLYYRQKNEKGLFKERAAEILLTKKFSHSTESYKAYIKGYLPDGHIHMMANRWISKLFMAHFFEESYRRNFQKEPPALYPIPFPADAALCIACNRQQ